MRRRFTPAQANRTLPLVRKIVGDILGHGRELRELSSRIAAKPKLEESLAPRAGVLEGLLHELMNELERIGCSYRDWNFEMGLVDFPGQIEGVDVLLCWRSDEPAVTWYHLPDAGFAGRRPIPEALLSSGE